MTEFSITFPPDHPCLAGHFPGRPLIPGVMLLDAVFHAAAEAGLGQAVRLRHAKFRAPVAPGVAVRIGLRGIAPGRIAFQCHCAETLALAGELDVAGPT